MTGAICWLIFSSWLGFWVEVEAEVEVERERRWCLGNL